MTSGKEKAHDECANVIVIVSASASANGHDPSVCDDRCVCGDRCACGDRCVYSSTTSDALNDGLHERPC